MGAISIAFGIGLQNFPEGAAVSVPLRREGAGRLRSFLLGQASGLVEPVAGVLGALLVGSVEAILPYALAFAAGAMILVAVHELIPECQRNREARPYTATMGIVARICDHDAAGCRLGVICKLFRGNSGAFRHPPRKTAISVDFRRVGKYNKRV